MLCIINLFTTTQYFFILICEDFKLVSGIIWSFQNFTNKTIIIVDMKHFRVLYFQVSVIRECLMKYQWASKIFMYENVENCVSSDFKQLLLHIEIESIFGSIIVKILNSY